MLPLLIEAYTTTFLAEQEYLHQKGQLNLPIFKKFLLNLQIILHNHPTYQPGTASIPPADPNEYVSILQWNLHYYFGKQFSWNHFYDKATAPTLAQLMQFTVTSCKFVEGRPHIPLYRWGHGVIKKLSHVVADLGKLPFLIVVINQEIKNLYFHRSKIAAFWRPTLAPCSRFSSGSHSLLSRS